MADKLFDDLESRTAEQRDADLMAALPRQIAHAQNNASAIGKSLDGVDAAQINTREALAALPVTYKSDLIELQRKSPPFGGFAATRLRDLGRVFASPGPIFEPEGKRNDYWRLARALFAAGIRSGNLIHNSFAYHFTPAGFMLESGAHALGCPVFPAGPGQTELQVQTMAQMRPTAYVGTPSFLKMILEKADEMDVDISSVERALVSGEALPPSLRAELSTHSVDVLQCYATADLGLIAYESEAKDGMILDEEIIFELVRPGTGDPVAEGEVGEIVVTTLNPDYPLVRFGTGDLSAILPGESPCGRTNTRIKGWMGRADQTTKVRGMFVHPAQIAAVVKRHPEIQKARLVVTSEDANDAMTLQCEKGAGLDESAAAAIEETIRDVCKLRGEVAFVDRDALPNDGKVIDDQRSYE